MSDDTLKSATRAFSGKDYYPTIAQLVWASEDDVNKILNCQQKSSLTCLLRQCLSQLKESLNKEQTMTDIVSTLSTGIGELKACIPKIESSVERVRDEVESVRANVTEIKAAERSAPPVQVPTQNLRESSTESHLYQIRLDGLPELDNKNPAEIIKAETAAVERVFNHLSEPLTICNLKRLGAYKKERSRPRTLLITLPRVWDVRKVLSKAPMLKSYNEKVYLSKGLGEMEIKAENAALKRRRELINEGIESSRLKIRQSKLYQDSNLIPLTVQ